MADKTILELSNAVIQLNDQFSLINSLVPTFDPEVDIHEFITRFETSTATLTDVQRSKVLLKSFPTGRCKPWFLEKLKPGIDEGKTWPDLKRMLIERFSNLEDKERHLRRIKELKFDPESNQKLLEFTEDLVYSFKKAYREFSESECVKFIKASYPQNLVAKLNLYPGFSEASTVDKIYLAAKQFDLSGIDISSNKAKSKEYSELIDVIKVLVQEQKTSKDAIVAALQTRTNHDRYSRSNLSGRDRTPDRSTSPYQRPTSPSAAKDRDQSKLSRSPRGNQDRQSRSETRTRGFEQRSNSPVRPINNNDQVKAAFDEKSYFEDFGKPTRPCRHCGYLHWERHCPVNQKLFQ